MQIQVLSLNGGHSCLTSLDLLLITMSVLHSTFYYLPSDYYESLILCFLLSGRGTETHCEECLRVTVGTRSENVRFLELLEATATEMGVV